MGFILRNKMYCLSSPRKAYKTIKAMNEYRKSFPNCAVCERAYNILNKKRKNDVHHIIPISLAPKLADDKKNFMTLCRFHHWWVGHKKNWKHVNLDIKNDVFMLKKCLKNILTKKKIIL